MTKEADVTLLQEASRIQKAKNWIPLEPSEGRQLCGTFFSNIQSSNIIHLCCFELLNLWHFVITVIENQYTHATILL